MRPVTGGELTQLEMELQEGANQLEKECNQVQEGATWLPPSCNWLHSFCNFLDPSLNGQKAPRDRNIHLRMRKSCQVI